MNRFLGIALASVCAGVGCNPLNSLSGRCNSDQDCGPGATCDHSTGTGVCVSQLCRPPCNSSQTCDPQTVTCKDVTSPTVAVTSPGANSFAGFSLQAAATARAPGGVGGLTFLVRNPTTQAVLVSVAGAPTATGSADFTATIPLNGSNIAEGSLALVATISYQTGKTLDSDPVTIKIDHTPPTLDMTGYDGTAAAWVGPGNPNAIVAAHVTDSGAGVDPAGVKLTVLPPGDGSSYTGVPGTGGTYTFTVPLAALGVADGTVNPAVPFKVDAKDAVGNAAAPQTGATLVIRVDRKMPAVTIAPDMTWYAGTAGPVAVTATISDADSGLVTTVAAKPFLKIGGGTPVPGIFVSGTSWTFSFDPSAQAANTESAVQFTITAQDAAGNVMVAPGSRNVDKKPPQVSGLQVFLESTTPIGAGVNYPSFTAPAGYATGRDGSHFIYTDQIHIKGTLVDAGAGLSGATAQFRLDGVDSAGAPVQGTPQTLSCADGASCSFDLAAGALISTRMDAGVGTITLVILSEDKAVKNDGVTAAHNSASALTPIAVTRLWWKRTFAGATVSGLAIYPDRDLIVSTATAVSQDSLFALFRDGPFHTGGNPLRWSRGKDFYGAGLDLGSIGGAPSIGGGLTTNERIYVATATTATTRGGDLVSVDGSGTLQWSCQASGGTAPLVGTPAVSGSSKLNGSFCEGVFAGSASNSSLNGACQNALTTGCLNDRAALTDAATDSPVTVLNQKFYVGTAQHVAQVPLVAGLANFGTPVNFPSTNAGAFTGVAISGTNLFAGSASGTVYGFASSNLAQAFATTVSSAIQGQPVVDPTTASGLVLNTADNKLHGLDISAAPPAGTDRILTSFLSAGHTPLLAADNRIYVGINQAVLSIDDSAGYATLWSFPLSANATVAPNMDCTGVLYVAASDTLYVLITDKVAVANGGGLRAGTDWPKFQRDSRNSGNGDATTTWGVRTASGCTQ